MSQVVTPVLHNNIKNLGKTYVTMKKWLTGREYEVEIKLCTSGAQEIWWSYSGSNVWRPVYLKKYSPYVYVRDQIVYTKGNNMHI